MSCFAKNHTGFYKVRAKRWSLCISESFAKGTSALKAGSEIVDGMRGPFKPVQCSRFARVSEWTAGFGGANHDLFIKQYLYRSVWDFVKHLLRPSRAMRAFKASIMLAENALLSPEVVAVGHLKFGPLCLKNMLITRKYADARDIPTCLDDFKTVDRSNRARRQFASALGSTIGQVHFTGVFLGDLRPRNVLARKFKDRWEFCFLDNERTRLFARLPSRFRFKNLVQINMFGADDLGRTDRMRFFKAYVAQNPEIGHDCKSLARQVAEKTKYRLEKKTHLPLS